ncbi:MULTISPECIES: hypothetical protein [unclassified Wenzhouxiangella]|uniref:hypothetical protein n=1 Tax=unclassified Wenzhouxiangella TaxID=2613841 RepID=UPI0011C0368F|nr:MULTISPECIES: hypothetical protein [unclassified Wenzhouxiangella]
MKLMNLLTGLALLPLSAVGADSCVLEADGGSEMASGDAVRALESPETARLPGTLEIVCQKHGIARIDIALPVGARRGLSLISGGRDGRTLQPQLKDTGSWASLAVEEGPDGATRLKVGFLAPASAKEGDAFTGSLVLIDPSSRSDEPVLTIPLNLSIRGEVPLFRDQFDVDPVIGQFSLVI